MARWHICLSTSIRNLFWEQNSGKNALVSGISYTKEQKSRENNQRDEERRKKEKEEEEEEMGEGKEKEEGGDAEAAAVVVAVAMAWQVQKKGKGDLENTGSKEGKSKETSISGLMKKLHGESPLLCVEKIEN